MTFSCTAEGCAPERDSVVKILARALAWRKAPATELRRKQLRRRAAALAL